MVLVPIPSKYMKVAQVWGLRQKSDIPVGFDHLIFKDARIDLGGKLKSFRNGLKAAANQDWDKDFLYEVRRAEREGVVVSIQKVSNSGTMKSSTENYLQFSKLKNIESISPAILDSYVTIGAFYLAEATFQEQVIRWHHYLKVDSELVFLSSFPNLSHPQNEKPAGGWSNRLLHYQVFQKLSELGCETYNLSGMGNPPTPATEKIIAFKNEMKPEIRVDYVGEMAMTPKAKAIQSAQSLLGRRKAFR